MRLINTSDLFKCARLLTDSGLKEEIKTMFAENNGKEITAQTMGFETLFRVISAVTTKKSEKQIYEIFADICEKTPDEIKNQHIDITMNDLDEIMANNDVKGFFDRVAKLIA